MKSLLTTFFITLILSHTTFAEEAHHPESSSAKGMQETEIKSDLKSSSMSGSGMMMDHEHMMKMHEHMEKMKKMMSDMKQEKNMEKKQAMMEKCMSEMDQHMGMMMKMGMNDGMKMDTSKEMKKNVSNSSKDVKSESHDEHSH